MRGEWPLIGRDVELRALAGLLRAPDCNGVVLAGPAGVGKTRLALETVAEAQRAGLPTVRASATRSSAHLPFGAMAPLLPVGNATPATVQDRAEFLRRCCLALAEQGGGRRLVLFVDDAYLLDPASATLTHQLAETRSAFVVATIRVGEPAPDPVVALWKDGLAERMDVHGLTSAAVEDLLEAVLEGPIDGASAARLATRCQGNVLFLRELVLGAVDSGSLAWDGGLWRLVGHFTPSDRLVELVEARLEGLGEAERNLLELVAFGEPLGPDELSRAADLAVAESMERHHLLRSRLDGRRLEIHLTHPIYGEVLRARMPALRARIVQRTLADALEATGARRRQDTLRVATWRLAGGGTVRPDVMLAAGQQARARWAISMAERLATAAQEAGAGFEAGLLVGQLHAFRGNWQEAEAVFAGLGPSAGDDIQRVQLASSRLNNLAVTGRLTEAAHVAQEAERILHDQRCRDEATANRAAVLGLQGCTTEAAELVTPLVPQVEGRVLVFTCFAASIGYAMNGRLAEAIEVAERGRAAYLELVGPPLPIDGFMLSALRILALGYAGRFQEVASDGAAELLAAVAGGSVGARAFISMFVAQGELVAGRVSEAARHAQEAAAPYRAGGFRLLLRATLIPLVPALAQLGRPAEAKAVLEEIDGLGQPPTQVFGPLLLEGRAWVEVATGDLPAAKRLLQEAAAMAAGNGDRVFEAAALHALARLRLAGDVTPRLAELANLVGGDLVAARSAHAWALATQNAVGLETVSQTFEAMEADLLAAEAAADAAGVWRQEGDPRRAAAAERRAATLGARCQGATTPALQALPARVILSDAERDVAVLAVAGRTNREIAELLHISQRTVENYLHRAYEKLGVSGRSELASALES